MAKEVAAWKEAGAIKPTRTHLGSPHRDVWLQRSALELTSKTSCSATQSTGQTRTAVFTGTAARAPARVCLHTRGSEQQRTATRLLTSRTLDCSRVCVCIYPQLHAQRDSCGYPQIRTGVHARRSAPRAHALKPARPTLACPHPHSCVHTRPPVHRTGTLARVWRPHLTSPHLTSPRPGRSPRRPPLTRSSRDHGAAPLNANEAAQFPAPAPADCVKTSAGPF